MMTAILLVTMTRLTKARSWWRGEWRSSRIRWRDRAWLTIVVSVAVLSGTMLIVFAFDRDTASRGALQAVRSLIILSGVLFLSVPLAGWTHYLDFVVAPHLRSDDTPPYLRGSGPVPPNRAERRARSRRRLRLGAPTPGRTAIRFHRPAIRFRDRFRAYRLEIDGEPVGEIRHGGEVLIVTTPGPRTVRARIDWVESSPLTVLVRPDRTVTVLVEPGDETEYLRLAVHD